MACRALYRSLHRPARSLLSIGCFRLHGFRSNPPQAVMHSLSQTGTMLSDFANVRPFSSAPQFSNTEDRSEVQVSDGFNDVSSSSSSAQELASNESLDIPSPIDLLIAGLDNLNNLTGLPWWGTILVSSIILRALMLPLKIIQERKLGKIRSLGPTLQLERLARGLSQGNFFEECRELRKRKQRISSPSLLWVFGPGICLQVPLVMAIMYSLRRMALEQHLGFATGGIMWFTDLTVPGQGLVGAVLPLLVGAFYFANAHVLFQGRPIRKGLLGDFQKAMEIALKCSTLFIFWWTCHAPQALQVLLVPHSLMTLSQTKLFENEKFVARVVKPKINAYETLLKDAGSCFNSGKSPQAIELLKDAIKEQPEKGEAYALLGLVYLRQKDWVNSAFYYKQAISKGETDDFKISAYAGCGVALLKEGAVTECIEALRPIRSFQVPESPYSRQSYYATLVILGRVLLKAGLKDEAQEVEKLYKELNVEKSES